MSLSLAGSFLVRFGSDDADDDDGNPCSVHALNEITGIDATVYPTDEARAWASLQENASLALERPKVVLNASFQSPECLEISCSTNDDPTKEDAALIDVLSRVYFQWIATRRPIPSTNGWTVRFPLGETITLEAAHLQALSATDAPQRLDVVRRLFATFDVKGAELVEMVNAQGEALGIVPRPLVHQYNLLHRGIGVLIAPDGAIRPDASVPPNRPPALYCHQRTSTKRIFPSLYDMFVGGISLADEDASTTARRELDEELGLTETVIPDHETKQAISQLSDRLWQCVVCTAYNRCVVDVFAYTMDTATETITWQAEEVAWGSFVPYHVVEAAADRSIARLVDSGQWPGRFPPTRSITAPESTRTEPSVDFDSSDGTNWRDWDFVPDGLLVWEAWLQNQEALHVE